MSQQSQKINHHFQKKRSGAEHYLTKFQKTGSFSSSGFQYHAKTAETHSICCEL